MAYVGTPLDTTNAFQSLAGKRFNGDGSTTDFTLDSSPNSTLDIEVFVGNVRQDPNSAYTVSGTTLGFTAAPPSGTNNIYVVHQAKSVGTIDVPSASVQSGSLNSAFFTGATDIGGAIADADLFLLDDGAGGTMRKTAASRLKTYIGGGITTASQWRLTTSATGDLEPIASNWEVNDTTGYGSLGSAMSESSGVFTFPSTGFWLITFICTWYLNGSSKWVEADIRTTTNNSSYTNASETYSHITQSESDTTYTTATAQTIFDVTNTSNCKVQFRSRVNNDSTTTYGSSSLNATGVTFVRLGDT